MLSSLNDWYSTVKVSQQQERWY